MGVPSRGVGGGAPVHRSIEPFISTAPSFHKPYTHNPTPTPTHTQHKPTFYYHFCTYLEHALLSFSVQPLCFQVRLSVVACIIVHSPVLKGLAQSPNLML
jgi:hypothetical protein